MKTASEYRAMPEDASDGRAKHGGDDGCGVSGCKPPGQSAIGKIIIFSQAVGNVAMLTINPQSAKPQPH